MILSLLVNYSTYFTDMRRERACSILELDNVLGSQNFFGRDVSGDLMGEVSKVWALVVLLTTKEWRDLEYVIFLIL